MRKQVKSKKSFNPNSDYIADAVEEYLKKGGKILLLKTTTQDEVESLPFNHSDILG